MTDMEKLELRRKVCEALGWTVLRECAHPHGMEGFDAQGFHREVPALESDNGLALDALVKWCEANDCVARLHLNLIGKNGIRECAMEISKREGSGFLGAPHWTTGETPAIAICKALIASAESIRKAGTRGISE